MRLINTFLLITIGLLGGVQSAYSEEESTESQHVKSETLEEIYLLCELSGQITRYWTKEQKKEIQQIKGSTTVAVYHRRDFYTDPDDNEEFVGVVIGNSGNPLRASIFHPVDSFHFVGETEIKLYRHSDDPYITEELIINRLTGILDFYEYRMHTGLGYERRFSGTCERQTKRRF